MDSTEVTNKSRLCNRSPTRVACVHASHDYSTLLCHALETIRPMQPSRCCVMSTVSKLRMSSNSAFLGKQIFLKPPAPAIDIDHGSEQAGLNKFTHQTSKKRSVCPNTSSYLRLFWPMVGTKNNLITGTDRTFLGHTAAFFSYSGMTVWSSIQKHTRDRKWSSRRLRGGGQTDTVFGKVTDQLARCGHSAVFSLIPVQKNGRCLFRAIVATVARMRGGMLSHAAVIREADDLRARTHQEITNRRRRFPWRFVIVLDIPDNLKTSAAIVRIPVKTEWITSFRRCVCVHWMRRGPPTLQTKMKSASFISCFLRPQQNKNCENPLVELKRLRTVS